MCVQAAASASGAAVGEIGARKKAGVMTSSERTFAALVGLLRAHDKGPLMATSAPAPSMSTPTKLAGGVACKPSVSAVRRTLAITQSDDELMCLSCVCHVCALRA